MIDTLIIIGGVAALAFGLYAFAVFVGKCIAFGMGDDE